MSGILPDQLSSMFWMFYRALFPASAGGVSMNEESTSGRNVPTCIVRHDILLTVRLEPSDVKPSMAFSNIKINASKSIVGYVTEVKGGVANNPVVLCTVVIVGHVARELHLQIKEVLYDQLSSIALE